MTGGQANFLQSLGWAVLNSLWQLALLWVLYQLLTAVFRKSSPSAKSSLATLLLITGFGWFIYTFISTLVQPAASISIGASAMVNAESNPELNLWLQRSLPVASLAYLVLLVFPLLHLLRNYRYVQVIRRFGLSKIDVQWRIFVQDISARMGIGKKVKIWVSEFVSSPVTIGFLKPVILVPLAAINHLSPQQLEAVLLHELAHIRRFDYLINLVIHFIQSILYFNPFAKAFLKIVENEREKSCDELVLQFQYDSHEYASALLTLEKNGLAQKPLAVGAAGKKHDLLNRVEIILGVHKKSLLSFNRLAGFMAGLLCIISLNALLIISRPVNGHKARSFASLTSLSNYFVNIPTEERKAVDPVPEIAAAPIENHIDKKTTPGVKPSSNLSEKSATMAYAFNYPDIINVNYVATEVPVLKKYQEAQVKEALEASRKVLQTHQWKTVEKSIADVFTEKEKELLKSSYLKEFEKFDWEQWENKLTLAYNKVDWEKVHSELSTAVNEIRLDSLQKVYTEAISKLDEVQKELIDNNLSGIPDTEITRNKVEQKRNEVKKALNNVKAVRTKKIVHL